MLEELRLNPLAPRARPRGRRMGLAAGAEGGLFDPRLSTGFAEGPRLRSTGSTSPMHSGWRRRAGEEVVG